VSRDLHARAGRPSRAGATRYFAREKCLATGRTGYGRRHHSRPQQAVESRRRHLIGFAEVEPGRHRFPVRRLAEGLRAPVGGSSLDDGRGECSHAAMSPSINVCGAPTRAHPLGDANAPENAGTAVRSTINSTASASSRGVNTSRPVISYSRSSGIGLLSCTSRTSPTECETSMRLW
jgi:hypothetical protein